MQQFHMKDFFVENTIAFTRKEWNENGSICQNKQQQQQQTQNREIKHGFVRH